MSDPNELIRAVREYQAELVRKEHEWECDTRFPTKWAAFQAGQRHERDKWIRLLLLVVGLPLAWLIIQLLSELLGG